MGARARYSTFLDSALNKPTGEEENGEAAVVLTEGAHKKGRSLWNGVGTAIEVVHKIL